MAFTAFQTALPTNSFTGHAWPPFHNNCQSRPRTKAHQFRLRSRNARPHVHQQQRVSSPTTRDGDNNATHNSARASVTDGLIQLDPSDNDEADWVIVDIRSEDLQTAGEAGANVVRVGMSTEAGGAGGTGAIADSTTVDIDIDQVGDDAKSLVRVALRDASVELSIVLCSDARIRELNAQFRGKDSATDVLSFPQDDPDRVVLGDIIVSLETAVMQAAERGTTLREEVRVLLVHGLLHLLGYDHEGKKEGDWLAMAQMENRLMGNLGWEGEGLVSASLQEPYRNIVQS